MNVNVYLLDEDSGEAARALCDRHLLAASRCVADVLSAATVLRRGDPGRKPRHPLPRYAAGSGAYATWVCGYGIAATREIEHRGLRDQAKSIQPSASDLEHALEALLASGPGLEPDPGFAGAPQRLDGSADLVVLGEPVVAYRRWYAMSKIAGAPRAWAGTVAAWTRRDVPAWLACDAQVVPECGWGGVAPGHPVRLAAWVDATRLAWEIET